MKNSEKRRNLRKKLMAALCMLLVSSTLLATTSYAWLILSTAPEVKGMQTTVGANGGLEIALLGSAESLTNPDGISSEEGDSSSLFGNSALTSNITWGNIVDLSDSAYGLNMIQLLPAKLDMDASGQLSQSLLSMPLYGTDGRVSETSNAYTNSSTFNESTMSFTTPEGDHYLLGFPLKYGVRGVGLSTNKTTRETAYDTGLSSGSTYGNTFRTAAQTSLNTSGKDLINIAVMHANGDDSYTWNEVKAMWDVVDAILGKKNENGTRENGMIATATQATTYYQIAAFASKLNETEYEDDAAFTAALESEAQNFQNEAVIELATKIVLLQEAAEQAETKLNTLRADRGTEYAYAEVSPVLDLLFSNMDLWGKSVEELKGMGTAAVAQLVMQNGMKLPANVKGGAFSLMADICGDFATKTSVSVSGFGLDTTLTIKHQAAKIALSNCANAIAVGAGKIATSTGAVVISDTYAYVVDMAFRTNAEESNLLLQTAATQRFTSSSSESTMGGGSTVTFTSTDDNFLAKKMLRLMDKIELVFFVPKASGGQEIIVKAKLDVENPTIDGLNPGDDGYATAKVNGKSITANVYLVDSNDNYITEQTDAVIMPLEFDVAQALSVLVYLNGKELRNADVATGAMSMTGSLNLQFSSSAPLTSMNYTAELGPANDTNTTEYDLSYKVLDDAAGATVVLPTIGEGENAVPITTVTRKQPLTFKVMHTTKTAADLSVGYTINAQVADQDSDGKLVGTLTATGETTETVDDVTYNVMTYTIPADQVTGHMQIVVEALKYKVTVNQSNAPAAAVNFETDGIGTRFPAGEDVVFTVGENYKVYIDGVEATAVDGKYTIPAIAANATVKVHAKHAVTIDGVAAEPAVQGESYDLGFSGNYVVEYTVAGGETKELSVGLGNFTLPGNELTGAVTVTKIPAVQVAQTASASVNGVETTVKLVRTDKDYQFTVDSQYGVWKGAFTSTGSVDPTSFTKLTGTNGTYTIAAADLRNMTLYVAKECTVTFTGTIGSGMAAQTVPEGSTVTIPNGTNYTVKVNGNEFTGTSLTVTGDMTVEISR